MKAVSRRKLSMVAPSGSGLAFKSEIERQIYAAAFVAEFNRLHELGVHASFRADVAAGRISSVDVVMLWEESCAENATHAAESAVLLHRKGIRSMRSR